MQHDREMYLTDSITLQEKEIFYFWQKIFDYLSSYVMDIMHFTELKLAKCYKTFFSDVTIGAFMSNNVILLR